MLPKILVSNKTLFQSNGFADKRATKPNLSLVNEASLDRILQAEVYVNEADGQLRAAHLILGYTPLSLAFQAPKCVIKAHDPWLHRISVAHQGFIIPEGVPIPKDTSRTQPLFVATPSRGASSSQLVLEEEEERSPEEVVDLLGSSDEFEIFNQTLSPEDVFDEMGVQRKPQRSLMELIENQPRKGLILLLLLINLNQLDLNLLIQKGGGSRQGNMWLRLEDLVRPVKTRPNELRSNKRSATHHNGA